MSAPGAGTTPAVILFDLDDTLFAHREAVGLGIGAHRRGLGGAVAAADAAAEVARWNALEEDYYHRYLGGELDFGAQRRERARAFMAPFASLSDAEATAWFEAYLVHYEASWALHPDAVRCLDALDARGIRVGIITNGELDVQSAKIARIGLATRVEHVVASGALGVAKPDPAIFRHAVELFAVDPGEAWYVGDRLRTDALGAIGAGLGGVWIDRPGVATPDELREAGAAGAAVIRDLDALRELL